MRIISLHDSILPELLRSMGCMAIRFYKNKTVLRMKSRTAANPSPVLQLV